ncbi:MAG TPA: M48 family metalloprotease [Firmicutes bacterium]|nr:M48 family metalloprotease [Bacillota bacterium]
MGEYHCPKCGAAVDRKAKFCGNCGLFLPSAIVKSVDNRHSLSSTDSPISLVAGDYAISVDLEVCRNLEGIPILRQAVDAFIEHWTNPLRRAELLGDGVRVSTTQLPTLHTIVMSACNMLKAPCPDLFIKQDPTLNAYTMGTNQDHIVVIHSGVLNMFEPEELAFIIGHEVGHIASRHVTYMTMARLMA